MWWKVTKSSLSSPFHWVCVVLSHMALMLATSLTKGKTTPWQSQPQKTAAPTAFSRSTPDPTVHHVPVIWILVLADRVEKRDKGRKEEAIWKLAWTKVFIILQNGKQCPTQCNGKSRRAQFHKKDLEVGHSSESFYLKAFHQNYLLCLSLLTFSVTCHWLWSRIHDRSNMLPLHIAQTQKYISQSIYLMFELAVSLDGIFFQKWKGTIWSCHWPLNFWPVPWHATLFQEQNSLTPCMHKTLYVLCGSLACHVDLLHKNAEHHVLHFASTPSLNIQESFESVQYSEMFWITVHQTVQDLLVQTVFMAILSF